MVLLFTYTGCLCRGTDFLLGPYGGLGLVVYSFPFYLYSYVEVAESKVELIWTVDLRLLLNRHRVKYVDDNSL